MILNMGGGGVVPKLNYDETTIIPGTNDHIIPSGTYHRGDMTILGDSDLTPENIVKNVDIFGVVGTYDPVSKETDLIPSNIRQGVDILGVVGTLVEGDGTWVETTAFTSTTTKTVYSAHSNPNAVYGGSYGGSGGVYDYTTYIGTSYVKLQAMARDGGYEYSGTIKISGNAITINGDTYCSNHRLAICRV